ncbi:prepilin peptidase [Tissierella sp.]|uniref:prepilin peptidase n=1 Tax=Tissierella sp. TaxID=41274 RepID=UPI00285D222D|nr:prepilin peptidase [Tissierella sp.]MDR7856124.1 prepilin peptidase [Tissierella sp.]
MQLLVFLYGLLIGSFLNVCIYRIPKKESIVIPSSCCKNCGTSLKWCDLIPLFSFIVQGGKCRYCKGEISPQYPIIELLNATIYLIIYLRFGFSLELFFYSIIFSLLIIISVIDLQNMIIPDILVVIIFGTAILYKLVSYLLYNISPEVLNSIGGLVFSSLLFILIIIISKGAMGDGDVTLIGILGFIVGIKKIFLTILASFILGAIISIFLLIKKIKGRKDPIPFGPFIILGFFITIFWGDELLNWYIMMF